MLNWCSYIYKLYNKYSQQSLPRLLFVDNYVLANVLRVHYPNFMQSIFYKKKNHSGFQYLFTTVKASPCRIELDSVEWICFTFCKFLFVLEQSEQLFLSIGIQFKVFVGRIFIAIHLHISDMSFLWRSGRVHLSKAVCDRVSVRTLPQHHNSNNDNDKHSYTSNSDSENTASGGSNVCWGVASLQAMKTS